MPDRTPAPGDPVEAVLRRDRLLTAALLALVCLVAWAYTVAGAGMEMSGLRMTPGFGGGSVDASMAMPMQEAGWSLAHATLMLAMWWVMMVAMMLPSAAPTILIAAAINRRSTAEHPPFGTTGFFLSGYLVAWLFYSILAVAAQYAFVSLDLLSVRMASTSPLLSAMFLIAAGLWQFSPVKRACLRHCREPISFLMERRGQGNLGALRTGLRHGTYCVGCCWLLMGLLFVGGVMNLYWIGALTFLVLVEKNTAPGPGFGRITAALLIVAGGVALVL